MKPVMLLYRHKRQPKPVGKCFTVNGIWICHHEESGSQTLHLFDAPGGVDIVVAQYLYQEGVQYWHHYDKTDKVLYRARVMAILQKGVEKQWDGRDRLFLDRESWKAFPGIFYTVPWIRLEKIVDISDITPETVAKFTPPPPIEQLGLF